MSDKRTALVMCSALILVMVGFANYAAVLPSILTDRQFTPAQGGIAGGAFFLAYAMGSPVFAALTDTRDAKRIYLLGCMFACAGGITFPILDDGFVALVVSRVLSGLGMAGVYMPGLRLLVDAVAPDERNRAASIYTSTITLGTSASFAVAALLEMVGGWSAAFAGATAAAASGAALVVLFITRSSPAMSVGSSRFGARLTSILRIPKARLIALAAFGNSWEGMAFRTWWIGLLTFSATQAGNSVWTTSRLALLSALAGLLAMPLSIWVAARSAKATSAATGYRIVAGAAASSLIVGASLLMAMDGPFVVVFCLSVLYLCAVFADAGAIPAAMLTNTPPEARGAALAVLSATGNVAAFAGTTACGVVVGLFGGTGVVDAWRAGLLSIMVGATIAVGAFWRLSQRAARSGAPAAPPS